MMKKLFGGGSKQAPAAPPPSAPPPSFKPSNSASQTVDAIQKLGEVRHTHCVTIVCTSLTSPHRRRSSLSSAESCLRRRSMQRCSGRGNLPRTRTKRVCGRPCAIEITTMHRLLTAALLALKKKKMYEQQLEQVENNILRINENQLMLESTSTQMETVGALHAATKASKQAMSDLNIDRVDKVLEEITETNDQLRMVQDALGAPLGPAAELDDDELLNELEVRT